MHKPSSAHTHTHTHTHKAPRAHMSFTQIPKGTCTSHTNPLGHTHTQPQHKAPRAHTHTQPKGTDIQLQGHIHIAQGHTYTLHTKPKGHTYLTHKAPRAHTN